MQNNIFLLSFSENAISYCRFSLNASPVRRVSQCVMIIEYKKLSAQNLAFISRGSTLNYLCGVKVEDEIERRYGGFKSRVLPEAFHFKVSELFAAVNGEKICASAPVFIVLRETNEGAILRPWGAITL